MRDVYLVVMAGGAGTRFWPASRQNRPKQLLPLGERPDESLIAATVRRLSGLIAPDHVYIATGAHLVDATARELPNVPRAHLLAEPVARNTAPCIGWAASVIHARDPEAVIAVVPSDHAIANEDAFRKTVALAVDGARTGSIVTIGIVPTRPETGYGYIKVGAEQAGGRFAVTRFVEKPDRATAARYVEGKKHLWNAGMFFFQAKVMQKAIERHLPSLAEGLGAIGRGADVTTVFPTLPSISIDHGVMVPASINERNLSVVPGDFGWNDVGSWESAWELSPKDEHGNALSAGALAIDAQRNLVRHLGSTSKHIALVGVHDLVVVETDDALLVMPRERAQDVRLVVEALRAQGKTDLL